MADTLTGYSNCMGGAARTDNGGESHRNRQNNRQNWPGTNTHGSILGQRRIVSNHSRSAGQVLYSQQAQARLRENGPQLVNVGR